MSRPLVLIIYNCLLPLLFIVAFPGWLIKMWKRGGYGTGLLERFGRFKVDKANEPQDVVYIHAVSVGEVLIAQKLIAGWLEKYPDERFVLAATTSTGHAIAKEKSPESVRVIYSPLDFGFLVRSIFKRFKPRQVLLIEAEIWPNFLNVARKASIPVAVVNARLSKRSEARYQKLSSLVQPLFQMVSVYLMQSQEDAERYKRLGIEESKIHVTGSIKFDPSGGEKPSKRAEFTEVIQQIGSNRPIVLASSTHAGEEKLIGEAIQSSARDALYLVVPRHAERRANVKEDLESLGYEVCLRSEGAQPAGLKRACLLADTTGELRDWTAHADIVVVGKSWLSEGGQSPAEAIMAGVPVICGPDMSNFEPLISMLIEQGGVYQAHSAEELSASMSKLLTDAAQREKMTAVAQKVLGLHEKAVEKAINLVYLSASVR